MYQFISSDMDGTILLNGAQFVDECILANVEKLTDMGVVFAPASGRQYPNLRMRFPKIADRLAYISENGAFVIYKNEVLLKNAMDRELAIDIMEKIYQIPQCEVLISGEQTSYLRPKTEAYLHRIRDVVKNNVVVVDHFCDIPEDVLKVSAYDITGIHNSADVLMESFKDKVQMAVSGSMYLDFTAIGVNKGNAVNTILRQLGIDKEKSASFGDNYNDIEMFQATGTAYCMSTAKEPVKKYADVIINNVNEVLEQLVKEICE